MSAPSRSSRRLRVVVGLSCLATAAVPALSATAAEEPGSGLQSWVLEADAPSLRVRQGNEQTEVVVPQALSTLRNGPVGFAQSSVAWPGTYGGNAGSLLVLAADLPPEATALDYPVRAEARTGSEPASVTNEDVPGTSMTARAGSHEVAARGAVGQATALDAVTIGEAAASSRTAVTGPRTAVAEAVSRVNDVSLLDGQVTVGAVRSTITASSDGTTAKATGGTVVSDLRIAGQAVTVDQDGVRLRDQQGPDAAVASQAVNAVLDGAGMSIVVSEATGEAEGGDGAWTSGSLVFAFRQSSGSTLTVVLGGANAALSVAAGDARASDLPGAELDAAAPEAVDAGAGPAPVEFDIGTGAEGPLPALEGPDGTAGVPAPDAPVAAPSTALLDRVSFAPPGGLGPAWLLLALVGAALVASALRNVPALVLAAPAAAPCPLEDR